MIELQIYKLDVNNMKNMCQNHVFFTVYINLQRQQISICWLYFLKQGKEFCDKYNRIEQFNIQ